MDRDCTKALLILLVPVVLSLLFLGDDMVFMYEDSAAYLLLGKSLWQGGGYRSIWETGDPIHIHFPPGLPLLLAPLWGLAGKHLVPAHLLMWVAYVVLTWLGYRLFSRSFHPVPAALWTVFIVSTPNFLRTVETVNSDLPFAALTLGGLLLLDGERPTARRWIGALLLFGAAFYVRTVGFVAFPAVAICAVLSSRRLASRLSMAAAAMLGGGLIMLPWILWTGSHPGDTYLELFLLKDPYDASLGNASPEDFLLRLGHGVMYYAGQVTRQVFYESAQVASLSPPIFAILAAWLSLVILAGWLRTFRSSRSIMAIYMAVYSVPILLWFWTYSRFVHPLLLPLGFCLADAVRRLLHWARARMPETGLRKIVRATALLALLGNLVGVGYDLWHPPPAFVTDYFTVHRSLAQMSSPGQEMASRTPVFSAWAAGLDARGLQKNRSPEEFINLLKGADWLLLSALESDAQRTAEAAVEAHPSCFEVVARRETAVLYRIHEPACSEQEAPTLGADDSSE